MPLRRCAAQLREQFRWKVPQSELNIFVAPSSYPDGSAQMPSKNERVELEMKMTKARQLASAADDTTRERLEALAAELAQKLREIDE